MSANRVLAAMALVGAAAALSACSHGKQALAVQQVMPDEFRVVSKAPLTLPPDYDLRPAAPGEPRPQELQPESAARLALLGERRQEERSDGEKLLAQKAGADKADPLARYVVDDEFGAIAYKDKSFADRVMLWKAGAPTTVVAANSDPTIEAKRIKELTGGKSVVIEKVAPKQKKPGL